MLAGAPAPYRCSMSPSRAGAVAVCSAIRYAAATTPVDRHADDPARRLTHDARAWQERGMRPASPSGTKPLSTADDDVAPASPGGVITVRARDRTDCHEHAGPCPRDQSPGIGDGRDHPASEHTPRHFRPESQSTRSRGRRRPTESPGPGSHRTCGRRPAIRIAASAACGRAAATPSPRRRGGSSGNDAFATLQIGVAHHRLEVEQRFEPALSVSAW